MSKPWLSIVVATYQAAGKLVRCLNSVVAQEFPRWELLIVDGGSTDGTVELVRQHEELLAWWDSKADSGIYDAWNRALPHTSGEYVCFIGADDVFKDSRALSRLAEATGGNQYDLVTSRGLIVDGRTKKGLAFGSEWNYDRIGRRMVVCHPGLLHRRSLFEQYGSFDSRYRIAGDLEFLLRLPKDIRTLHVDAVTVIVEAGGVSRSKVMSRLREQRQVLARCERYGPIRAYIAWLDKLWRLPVARVLNIPH